MKITDEERKSYNTKTMHYTSTNEPLPESPEDIVTSAQFGGGYVPSFQRWENHGRTKALIPQGCSCQRVQPEEQEQPIIMEQNSVFLISPFTVVVITTFLAICQFLFYNLM